MPTISSAKLAACSVPNLNYGHIRGGFRLLLFVLLLMVAGPLFVIVKQTLKEERRMAVVRGVYRLLPRILGIRIVQIGKPVNSRPCLYVANHLSYTDIPVLASILKATFVSRGDVNGWPVIGWLARQQRVLFISRRKEKSLVEVQAVRQRLEGGERILMFPEGTSSDGQRVLPFKSTFFAIANPVMYNGIEQQVAVQPISMTPTELGGLPIGRHQRPLYCWYGDMEFAPHLWDLVQLAGFTVEVRFHTPTTLAEMGDRKKLAHYCEETIAAGLSEGLSGHRTLVPHKAKTA